MRTIHTAAAAAAGLATVLGGTLVAGAGGTQGGQIIELVAQTEQFAFIDVGPPGPPGLGDEIVSSDKVFRKGKQVGTDGSVCTIVKATPQALTCNWVLTISLPEGQVVLQGIADGPTGPPTEPIKATFAVTGGTGHFRSVTGVADVVDNPGGVEQITLRLNR